MVWAGASPCGCAAATPGKRISATIVTRQRAVEQDDDSRADVDVDEATAERGYAEAEFLRTNREYLDWWLLQKFPGRTLEELDGVDWLRLMRAEDVGRIVDVERRYKLWHAKKDRKPDEFTAAEWRMIRQHDRLAGDDGDQ